MKRRRKVRGGMTVRAYDVLRRAVEEGVACGYRRAHKHTAKPGEDAVLEHLERETMNAICEVFDFDDGGEDA